MAEVACENEKLAGLHAYFGTWVVGEDAGEAAQGLAGYSLAGDNLDVDAEDGAAAGGADIGGELAVFVEALLQELDEGCAHGGMGFRG